MVCRILSVMLALGFVILSFADKKNFHPKNGYVPDSETAITIAVAVWAPIYGRDQIEKEKPYHAVLRSGTWTVTGSLPENADGGVAEADISKETGCILRIIHGQ
jgi:hypothetical protein